MRIGGSVVGAVSDRAHSQINSPCAVIDRAYNRLTYFSFIEKPISS
jgi:hypothetical protein